MTGPRPWMLALAALIAWGGAPSIAQDILDEEDEVRVAPAQPMAALNEANFDRWVFGNINNPVTPRDRLESLLTLNLDELERVARLTEAQRKKLLLAGHGDIKRFLDRVAEARKVFFQLRADQNNLNQIFQETRPLAATLAAGLFGEDSFFGKTVRTILDEDQAGRYRESLREKARYRYRAKVAQAVANLDANVGFTAEQRRRLIDLAVDQSTPPEKPAGQFEATLVLYKISRLPEDKLRSIVDDDRWRAMGPQLRQARGMEAFFRSNGYLSDAAQGEPPQPGRVGR